MKIDNQNDNQRKRPEIYLPERTIVAPALTASRNHQETEKLFIDPEGMYGRRARYYDLIYHWKDRCAEAARLREVLSQEGVVEGASLLEAACGTGTAIEPLQKRYSLKGFDLSPAMLEIARSRLPNVYFFEADMTNFSVEQPVDALLCLASSIAYVYPENQLRTAAENFARAVRPGGVLIIEPWLTEETFKREELLMHTYESETVKLCRSIIRNRDGQLVIAKNHWLAWEKGMSDVEYFSEFHHLWLWSTQTLLETFESAGFKCRVEPNGLSSGKLLIVGRRCSEWKIDQLNACLTDSLTRPT